MRVRVHVCVCGRGVQLHAELRSERGLRILRAEEAAARQAATFRRRGLCGRPAGRARQQPRFGPLCCRGCSACSSGTPGA